MNIRSRLQAKITRAKKISMPTISEKARNHDLTLDYDSEASLSVQKELENMDINNINNVNNNCNNNHSNDNNNHSNDNNINNNNNPNINNHNNHNNQNNHKNTNKNHHTHRSRKHKERLEFQVLNEVLIQRNNNASLISIDLEIDHMIVC